MKVEGRSQHGIWRCWFVICEWVCWNVDGCFSPCVSVRGASMGVGVWLDRRVPSLGYLGDRRYCEESLRGGRLDPLCAQLGILTRN
jgi:hypothetical protein